MFPCVSRAFERIIPKHFSSFVDKFLSPYLCGYRKGFHAHNVLLSIIKKWKKTFDCKGYTGALLMALWKDFDSINHQLLIGKLYDHGFSKDILYLIFSYMSDHRERSRIDMLLSHSSSTRIKKYLEFKKVRILFKGFLDGQLKYCPLTWMFYSKSTNRRINHLRERVLILLYDIYDLTFEELKS